VRAYERGEKVYTQATATTPTQANQTDNNQNGTPDYVDYLNGSYTAADEALYGVLYFKKIAGGTFSIVPVKTGGSTDGLTLLTQSSLTQYLYNANKSSLFSDTFGTLGNSSSSTTASLFNTTTGANGASITDISSEATDEIESQVDSFIKKLGCGFGGGACWSSPLNWAPLAPGSVPTVFGYPAGAMTPSTGLPVFSALTGIRVKAACVPSTYPTSALSFPGCTGLGAGGML